jgi:hypothetical protein
MQGPLSFVEMLEEKNMNKKKKGGTEGMEHGKSVGIFSLDWVSKGKNKKKNLQFTQSSFFIFLCIKNEIKVKNCMMMI